MVFASSSPGVYVFESTAGAIPADLAEHQAVYMLIHSDLVGAPTGKVFVGSPEEFNTLFGGSLSARSVQLFFRQFPGVRLCCVNVQPREEYPLSIDSVAVGSTYSVTVEGATASVVAIAGDTVSTLLARLGQNINDRLAIVASYKAGVLRVEAEATVTVSSNVTLGTVSTLPSYPTIDDVLDTVAYVFTKEDEQGFVIAPEFFQSFTDLADHNALANGLEAFAASSRFFWVALIDCRPAVANPANVAAGISLTLAERSGLASPRGHAAYYAPYWVDTEGQLVPASASVAAIAVKRARERGYGDGAPAGTRYPVAGVRQPSVAYDDQAQAILNEQNINILRQLPRKGNVIYGARTLATAPEYRFITWRIALNILAGTIRRDTFDSSVFDTIDGQGQFFARLKGTACNICERLRVGRLIFGASPEDAYRVIADLRNNNLTDLENGIAFCDVYVKLSPLAEQIGFRIYKTSLGTAFEEVIPGTSV